MNITELILISIGLAMDAFAVSICKGLSVPKVKPKHALAVGLYFGGFQALMPLLGYFLGVSFRDYIEAYDHWIAFGLLLLIGLNMIKEAFQKEEPCGQPGSSKTSPDAAGPGKPATAEKDTSFGVRAMLLLAIATSIDALAVGVSFAMVGEVNIWIAVLLIGVITCVISCAGIYIGNIFGSKYKAKAEFAGGIILILIGLKILLEHLGVLNF